MLLKTSALIHMGLHGQPAKIPAVMCAMWKKQIDGREDGVAPLSILYTSVSFERFFFKRVYVTFTIHKINSSVGGNPAWDDSYAKGLSKGIASWLLTCCSVS